MSKASKAFVLILLGLLAVSSITYAQVANGGVGNLLIKLSGTAIVPANSAWSIGGLFQSSGYAGIGTTTPHYALQIASSTGPQLGLSDGSLTASQWVFRTIAGTLYLGTTSPSTFATSTPPVLALTNSGLFGIGTTSPFAQLSVVATSSTLTSPLAIATSSASNANTPIFQIDASGHFFYSGPTPTVSACGSSPSVSGNDNVMIVTTGSSGITECTVTFAKPWASAPVCSFDDQSSTNVSISGSTTPTTLSFGLSVSLTSANIGVICSGKQ